MIASQALRRAKHQCFSSSILLNRPSAIVTISSEDRITSLASGKAPTCQLCNLPKPPVGSEALSWVVIQGTLHCGNRGTDVRVQCEIASYHKTAPPDSLAVSVPKAWAALPVTGLQGLIEAIDPLSQLGPSASTASSNF
ncbi:hypothetical protein PCANC_02127 [Puccinia coronata f. sp. avenae]|uniref:Uncharacterized protein n=1 Tax=Puccinia coronata f. sp. avenae TaxID=200324 RepID=A0A2N5VZZ6_9BASI|nr:hypothetical protein PCANC_02127 [Puccinia coronata f. sp. avenae]